MNVFAQARNNLNLTPGQRAYLKLVRYCLLAGLIAALTVISQAVTAQSFDWLQVLHTALATFLSAGLLALVKYLTARNEPPLGGSPQPPPSIANTAIQPSSPIPN